MIICSPQLGLSPESNLGGEVHDREMIKALDGLGVTILVILPWGKKYPPLKHAKIYFLPVPFVYPPWLFNLLVFPYLFPLYWKYHFNVLRAHSPYFVGFGALLFKLFNQKVKVVATYHHLDRKLNFIDRFLLNKFDVVTTVSEATRLELGKGVVIPNGVDNKYKPLPKNKKLMKKYQLKDKTVLLYLGQLVKRKNISFLFKVIKKLPNNYVLMVCGDGPVRHQLENEAGNRVIFTGKIPEKEKVHYYNLTDVFVYPSLKEGYGLSVAEAMACGKPVVAANVPITFNTPLDPHQWIKKILKPNKSKFNISSWKESSKLWLQAIK